jgi:Fe(3+) dicitrate transport protein
MKPFFYTIALIFFCCTKINAQKKDTTLSLKEVHIKGYTSFKGMGYLKESHDAILFSGQKNEVLILDSTDANTAQDNPRQTLGRVPGSNYSETEGNGFPSNGIGFRGLNPTQSIETNTRQNGYNIAGDLYGYPESYYLTPLEAVDRVEIIRGASSLQFGPQFGGVINYIVRKSPDEKPFEFTTEQTGGSYGLMNSFNAIGGTIGKWNYYAFVKAEYQQGWRNNAQMQQVAGFGRLEYKPNNDFKIGLEYSLLRNLLHMPGGLDDSAFKQNAQQSFRSRNWLTTPWNILAITSDYHINDNTLITLKSALNFSERSIVWRNEDGGPQTQDSISTLTNTYVPREVEHEYFKSSTTELRCLYNYSINQKPQIIALGVRFFYGWMQRQEGGLGSTDINADFMNYNSGNDYDNNLVFTTVNVAPFIENTFHVGKKLSITPGFRLEYIQSTAKGTVLDSTGTYKINVNESKPRFIPLAGIAFQYKTTLKTNIYANITQAYTPISYSFLYPMGLDVDAKIDPNLKDISGYNIDLGWRGDYKKLITFDASLFYMAHKNNIAIEVQNVNTNPTYFETNVGDALHVGLESYVEVNVFQLFSKLNKISNFSIFNSFAYDNATYVNGLYKGNIAEYAPKTIERLGLLYSYKNISTTFLFSHTAQSFADANNTIFSTNAEVGIIPAYTVMDWALTAKFKQYNVKIGINNVADYKYFTFRTIEYPGPGIIPSAGRTFYIGFGATL